jgi:hypothetical protein
MPRPDLSGTDLVGALAKARSSNREFVVTCEAWSKMARQILDAAPGATREAFTQWLLLEVAAFEAHREDR